MAAGTIGGARCPMGADERFTGHRWPAWTLNQLVGCVVRDDGIDRRGGVAPVQCQSNGGSDEVERDELGPRREAQLREDVAQVEVDRARGYEQLSRDVAVVQPLAYQCRDVA